MPRKEHLKHFRTRKELEDWMYSKMEKYEVLVKEAGNFHNGKFKFRVMYVER